MRDPLLMGLPDTVARAWIRRLVAKTTPSGFSQFRSEVEGRKFRNPDTGNDVLFQSLPTKEQARIYAEWRRKQRGDEPRKEKERGLLPIDKKKAREEAKRLADRISDWKVRDPEEEIGKRFLPGMGREIQMGKMFFESVTGRPRPVKIVLNHKPTEGLWTAGRHFVTGGSVNFRHLGDKSAFPTELTINLDSSRRYEQFTDPKNKDRIEREIYSVLIHEMTHARDLIESLSELEKHKEKSKRDNVSEYHNRPSEVRAFKRQVADEVWNALERMHEDEDEPNWIGAGAEDVMDLMAKSPTWYRVRHFLTPENRKEFLKSMASVVRKYKEDRGGKVATRVASQWLRRAVSQERVDDLMAKVKTEDLPFDHLFSGKRRMVVDPKDYRHDGLVKKVPSSWGALQKFLAEEGVFDKSKDKIDWKKNLITTETEGGKTKTKGKLSKLLNKHLQKKIKGHEDLMKARRRAQKLLDDEETLAHRTFRNRYTQGMAKTLGYLAPVVMEDFPVDQFNREMRRYGYPSPDVAKKVEKALEKLARLGDLDAKDDEDVKKKRAELEKRAEEASKELGKQSFSSYRERSDALAELDKRARSPGVHKVDLRKIREFYDSDEAKEEDLFQQHELGKDIDDEEYSKLERYMNLEEKREGYADWKSIHGKDLVVLLSRDPVDVLRMSDHPDAPKKIESCHSEGGQYFECAVNEAEEGGLVAYVVERGDVEDKDLDEGELFEDKQRDVSGIKPYSRLRFRRFENDNGFEIAIPEERTYGADLDSFEDVMLEWARDKQPELLRGEAGYSAYPKDWKLTGGSYQDTDSSDLFINFFDLTDKYDYRDTAFGRSRVLRDDEDDEDYYDDDFDFSEGDPFEEDSPHGPRQVKPDKKYDDQGEFWSWMREKHPKVPNPNPRGRQKEVTPDTLKGYARGNTAHSGRARSMIERYYAKFYDEGGVSGEEFAKVKGRTAAAWLRRVVSRL